MIEDFKDINSACASQSEISIVIFPAFQTKVYIIITAEIVDMPDIPEDGYTIVIGLPPVMTSNFKPISGEIINGEIYYCGIMDSVYNNLIESSIPLFVNKTGTVYIKSNDYDKITFSSEKAKKKTDNLKEQLKCDDEIYINSDCSTSYEAFEYYSQYFNTDYNPQDATTTGNSLDFDEIAVSPTDDFDLLKMIDVLREQLKSDDETYVNSDGTVCSFQEPITENLLDFDKVAFSSTEIDVYVNDIKVQTPVYSKRRGYLEYYYNYVLLKPVCEVLGATFEIIVRSQ